MGHRAGESRTQATLFPVMLDELVAQDAMVRVVDAWVNSLKPKALGFAKAHAQATGSPPYDPADLLKLYIWGYLNAVRSSRKLEQECHRDVECMWLLGRLAPDHKTIANFRRENAQPLVSVCAAFVQFAREQRLVGSIVAIDGSKVRAVASRKAVVGKRELAAQAQAVQQYLQQLDESDRAEAAQAPGGSVAQTLEKLRARRDEIAADAQRLAQGDSVTLVKTEPEARAVRGLGGAPGYNVQTAVDTQSHLIVAHEVVSSPSDGRQLQPMAEAARDALQQPCTVIADAGYANGEQLANLQQQGITAFVAVHRSPNTYGGGLLYDRTEFQYDAASDQFTCPAGNVLSRVRVDLRDKAIHYAARAKDCRVCPKKPLCTNADRRQVSRHLHEDALQANAKRLAEQPQMMQLRRQTAEHPFADIKHKIFGNSRFLLRGRQGAKIETALAVMAYNLKRLVNLQGAHWMNSALRG